MPRDKTFTHYTTNMNQLYVVLDRKRQIVQGVFKGKKGFRKAPLAFPTKKEAIDYRNTYHVGGIIARVTLFVDKVYIYDKPTKSLRGDNAEY